MTMLRFRRRASLGATLWVVIVLAGLAAASSALAQSEEGVKSAFIYNFAKFVEWPAGAFSSPSAPVTVGFIGGDALADTFSQNVQGKNANGRDLVAKKLSGADGADQCQIVYVLDAARLAEVAAKLKGKPVLIIGETDNVFDAGGMIRFVKDGARVAFELNLTTAGGAGLKVDPKLQKVARSVKGG